MMETRVKALFSVYTEYRSKKKTEIVEELQKNGRIRIKAKRRKT